MNRRTDQIGSRALRNRAFGVGAALIAVVAVMLGAVALPADASDYRHGEIIVQLHPGVPIERINIRYETTTLDSIPPIYLLHLPASLNETQALMLMGSDPDIARVEFSCDNQSPEGERQMMVAAIGGTIEGYLDQRVAARIHLADIQEHLSGEGVLVAVIDTGVLASHPALANVIVPGGWDFVDNDADPTDAADGIDEDGDGAIDEGAGHGTMVAGIIHLTAPGARILPIRVLDDEGNGTAFNAAKGILYALEHGAQVINLSLGLMHSTFVIQNQILLADGAGAAMVAAAGNTGLEHPEYYPASDSHVLSVAALDSSDVKADFSSFNPDVDLSAPGVGIMAPYYDGEYAIGAGTSFSAPFVSGQLALILSLSPTLPTAEALAVARQGVVDIYGIPGNEPYTGLLGTGRVDGLATWERIQGIADVPAGRMAGGDLLRIYPNPARRGERIVIDLPGVRPRLGTIGAVYDLIGRLVGDIDVAPDGATIRWSAGKGRPAAPGAGIYFTRIRETPRARPVSGRFVLTD